MPSALFSRGLITLLLPLPLLLSACGGGGDAGSGMTSAPAAVNELLSLTVSGYPHAVDVYKPAGATRALVLLHGGGGNKSAIAYQLGLNADPNAASLASINWTWLAANKLMLVLPQGQHLATEPNATTWSNYAMNSGQDDKGFLQALAARIRSDYGGTQGITQIALAGHSMGGVMSNRMWCESPTTFDAYISLAGPASTSFNNAATPCQPGADARPYLGIIGDVDNIMQDSGAWEASSWAVNPVWVAASATAWLNALVIGEFHQQQARAALMCGELLAGNAYTSAGNVDSWSSCGGRLQLKRVRGAEHDVASIDAAMGTASGLDVANAMIGFLSR